MRPLLQLLASPHEAVKKAFVEEIFETYDQ